MNKILPWQLNSLDLQLIDIALTEDLGTPYHDVTTAQLFAKTDNISKAKIISKSTEPLIICGLSIVNAIINKLGYPSHLAFSNHDGDSVNPGMTLLTLELPSHILLMAERTILNFLQRLCAISTLTAQFVNQIKHTTTKILDTRKTHPGFRHLGKYAVHCGGGVNHRMGLYDAIMIKDTHIDALGGMLVALNALPDSIQQKVPVIVEVRNQAELEIVLNTAVHKVTRVLLDNMQVKQITECVAMCKGIMPTEASGGITLNNVQGIADCGVDFVSIGQLTHSAGNVDLSMICEI